MLQLWYFSYSKGPLDYHTDYHTDYLGNRFHFHLDYLLVHSYLRNAKQR